MHRITITLFESGHIVPAYDEIVDHDQVLIQVADNVEGWGPEFYDFRLSAPVHEHVLDEVYQLVSDLIGSHVAQHGGLQPSLFA